MSMSSSRSVNPVASLGAAPMSVRPSGDQTGIPSTVGGSSVRCDPSGLPTTKRPGALSGPVLQASQLPSGDHTGPQSLVPGPETSRGGPPVASTTNTCDSSASATMTLYAIHAPSGDQLGTRE